MVNTRVIIYFSAYFRRLKFQFERVKILRNNLIVEKGISFSTETPYSMCILLTMFSAIKIPQGVALRKPIKSIFALGS